MINLEKIKNKLKDILNDEFSISRRFILYSKKYNYSELVEFKNNIFKIIKICNKPKKTNIFVYDNNYLTQNEVDHAIALTNYNWNKHYKQNRVINVEGIEFIGGDKKNSVECINLIINYDKLIETNN